MSKTAPKVAIVTGGARGIGRGCALELAARGYDIALVDLLEPEMKRTAGEIEALGRKTLAYKADVASFARAHEVVADVARQWSVVDFLLNDAGASNAKGILEIKEEEFDRTIAVNLKSAFLCTQAVVPAMRAKKWGRIVNISSGAARGAGAIGVHYNASKAGMEGLTRGYAARLVKEGITVNAVAPSLIATDMMGGRTDLARNIPLGRMGQAEEVAQAVAMVLGNSYMTGQTIVLNGGMAFI